MYGQQNLPLKAKVAAFAGQSLTPKEIAEKLDANLKSVQTYCSDLGLTKKTPKLDLNAALALEAEDRGITRKELVRQLLTAIIKGELFSSILGDTPS